MMMARQKALEGATREGESPVWFGVREANGSAAVGPAASRTATSFHQESIMPLRTLLRNLHKRTNALADLEEVYGAVFGHDAGDEPNVYADYDRCLELSAKMRRAIETLRVS